MLVGFIRRVTRKLADRRAEKIAIDTLRQQAQPWWDYSTVIGALNLMKHPIVLSACCRAKAEWELQDDAPEFYLRICKAVKGD